jgi:hypothetical protein
MHRHRNLKRMDRNRGERATMPTRSQCREIITDHRTLFTRVPNEDCIIPIIEPWPLRNEG